MNAQSTNRRGWIVRTGDIFDSEEEAMEAGRDHCDPGFVVMRDPR